MFKIIKTRVSCFIYLLLVSGVLFSQNEQNKQLDSLITICNKQKGLEKIKTLSAISYVYIDKGDFISLEKYNSQFQAELQRCTRKCDEYWIKFYNQSVVLCHSRGDYKGVFSFLFKAINFKTNDIKAINDKCKSYRNLIAILITMEQYDTAQQYAKEAEEFVSKNQVNQYNIVSIYLENANVNLALLKNAEKSRSADTILYKKNTKNYYEKAFNYFTKISKEQIGDSKNEYYQILCRIPVGLFFIGNDQKAEKIFHQFDSLYQHHAVSDRIYAFSKNIEFDIKSKSNTINNPDSVILSINKIIALYDDKKLIGTSKYDFIKYKSRVLFKAKKYREAEKESSKVYEFFQKNHYQDEPTKLEIIKLLGDVYEILGDDKKALKFKNESISFLRDIVENNTSFAKQKAEIDLFLEKQKQQKQLELERLKSEKRQTYFVITVLSLIVILGIAFTLMLINKHLRTRKNLLQTQLDYTKEILLNEEMEAFYKVKLDLENKKTVAFNSEKIAKNIHDNIASSLAALNFLINDKLSFTKNSQEKKNFLQIKEETSSLYQNVKDYISSLHKQDEEVYHRVSEYLIQLITKSKNLNNVKIDIEADFELIDTIFTDFQHNQLYRILKEAVANSLKYSQAKSITIEVKIIQNQCMFSVKDNGIGIDKNYKKGIGLISISERVKSMNGEYKLDSLLGEGTNLMGSFPLDRII